VLLERAAGDAAPGCEHAVVGLAGDFDEQAQDRVNRLGAEGFRLRRGGVAARRVGDWWLPGGAYEEQVVLILERPVSGDAVPHEYRTLAVQDHEALYDSLSELASAGFEVAGLLNTARRLRLLLERRLDGPADAGTFAVDPYRLLVRAKKRSLRKQLRIAGREGFRAILAVDQSINAPPMVLLERAAGPAPEFEYGILHEPLKRLRKDKLEKKLNRRATQGFRLAPEALTARVMVLEPLPPGAEPAHYRIATAQAPPALPAILEEAAAEGYRFRTLFLDAGAISVVLERQNGGASGRRSDRPSSAGG
jgi:hypothetical protein